MNKLYSRNKINRSYLLMDPCWYRLKKWNIRTRFKYTDCTCTYVQLFLPSHILMYRYWYVLFKIDENTKINCFVWSSRFYLIYVCSCICLSNKSFYDFSDKLKTERKQLFSTFEHWSNSRYIRAVTEWKTKAYRSFLMMKYKRIFAFYTRTNEIY